MPGLGPAVPQQCPETGANFLMGGPFWADPIHNMDWVVSILKHVQVWFYLEFRLWGFPLLQFL